MNLATSNLEILFLCLVIFLGIIALALIVQVYLLYRLFRELKMAGKKLDTANRSIGSFVEALTPVVEIMNKRIDKGKSFLQTFDEAAEVVQSTTVQLESIIQKLFAQLDDLIRGFEKPADLNDSFQAPSEPTAQPNHDQTQYEQSDQNDELLVYERQRE